MSLQYQPALEPLHILAASVLLQIGSPPSCLKTILALKDSVWYYKTDKSIVHSQISFQRWPVTALEVGIGYFVGMHHLFEPGWGSTNYHTLRVDHTPTTNNHTWVW